MLIKDLFGNIKKEVFRLELLDYYDEDKKEFQKFKNGNIFIDSETKQFCKIIRQLVCEGKRIIRVRVIPETLTEYLKFEIKTGYLPQLNAGAEIYLISREKYKQLLEPDFNPDDFFVFDNHTIVELIYDDNGSFLREEIVKDIETKKKYLALKRNLIKQGTPLEEYLKNNPIHQPINHQ